MLDIVLIVLFCIKLNSRLKQAGFRSGPHIIRLIAFWITSELLGMYILLRFGFDWLGATVGAVVLGCVAGILSYKKSLSEIAEIIEHSDGDFPRLNG